MQRENLGLRGWVCLCKSTIARVIAGLFTPNSGKVTFEGVDLTGLKSEKERRPMRRHQMQMVFQNPYTSMNLMHEDFLGHHRRANCFSMETDSATRTKLVRLFHDLLDHVGLGKMAGVKYPHEFSGGPATRYFYRSCLATRPRLRFVDEPTSALDARYRRRS